MTIQVKTDYSPRSCTKSRRCHDWRHCGYCSRIRQAQIADAVERLQAEAGALRWHILYPSQHGQAALEKARANWLRQVKPRGAVWTVEQSRKTGALHCNIITPAQHIYTPNRGAYWHQTIAGDVRAVGAYISKRGQYPREQDYTGRLYGTAGQLWQVLTEQRISPIVAAAAAQYSIDSHAMIERAASLALSPSERNKRKWLTMEQIEAEQQRPTREQARDIAAKWLPALQAFKTGKPPNSNDR